MAPSALQSPPLLNAQSQGGRTTWESDFWMGFDSFQVRGRSIWLKDLAQNPKRGLGNDRIGPCRLLTMAVQYGQKSHLEGAELVPPVKPGQVPPFQACFFMGKGAVYPLELFIQGKAWCP